MNTYWMTLNTIVGNAFTSVYEDGIRRLPTSVLMRYGRIVKEKYEAQNPGENVVDLTSRDYWNDIDERFFKAVDGDICGNYGAVELKDNALLYDLRYNYEWNLNTKSYLAYHGLETNEAFKEVTKDLEVPKEIVIPISHILGHFFCNFNEERVPVVDYTVAKIFGEMVIRFAHYENREVNFLLGMNQLYQERDARDFFDLFELENEIDGNNQFKRRPGIDPEKLKDRFQMGERSEIISGVQQAVKIIEKGKFGGS